MSVTPSKTEFRFDTGDRIILKARDGEGIEYAHISGLYPAVGDHIEPAYSIYYETDKPDEDPVMVFDREVICRASKRAAPFPGTPLPMVYANETPSDDETEEARFLRANGGEELEATAKRSNPKDAVGSRKSPMSTVPEPVIFETGLAMLEGGCKYGRHNYRIAGVRASVYYDAAKRHLAQWWEGDDIDEDTCAPLRDANGEIVIDPETGKPKPDLDTGLSHIVKCIASLVVLRDAMHNDMLTDDRPPPMKDQKWMRRMNKLAEAIIDRIPNHKPPFTRDDKPVI